VIVLGEREVHRDRLGAQAHLERDAMVLQQQRELVEVVVGEEIGPRERGLVGAGAGDEAIGQPRVGAGHRVGVHPQEGVAGAHVLAEGFAGDEALQAVTQVGDATVVDRGGVGQRGSSVVERLGVDQGRGFCCECHERHCASMT